MDNKKVKQMMEKLTGGQFVTWPWDGSYDFNCWPKYARVISLTADQLRGK